MEINRWRHRQWDVLPDENQYKTHPIDERK